MVCSVALQVRETLVHHVLCSTYYLIVTHDYDITDSKLEIGYTLHIPMSCSLLSR